jgi:hypothetical protein
VASGSYSHAEGFNTLAFAGAHAEGQQTQAIGAYSHAAGYSTTASGSYQSVIGQFNVSSSAQSAFIVGNGTAVGRSNLIFASGSQVQVTGSLMVNDILQLARRATLPSSPVEGMVVAQGTAGSSTLYYYNGTSWFALF